MIHTYVRHILSEGMDALHPLWYQDQTHQHRNLSLPQLTAMLSVLQLTCDNPSLADREQKLVAVMIQKSSRPHEQGFHGHRLSVREIKALLN